MPVRLHSLAHMFYRHSGLQLLRALATGSLFLAVAPTYASDALFLEAIKSANSDDSSTLAMYQSAMQNSVLQYYPEYWRLNNNLVTQPATLIAQFAQRYPQSAMAEKLAADYVEEKVKVGDFQSAAQVLAYVTNPDRAEQCAVAQARAKTGDPLVFAEFKDVWLKTDDQPESCHGLGRLMLNSPLMTAQDRQHRLWAQLRSGKSGVALATAQTMGLTLSLAQLNQIQANPLNYLWSAPKATATDHAYLIFALGRVADQDLNSALANMARVADQLPQDVQRYVYRTVGYVGGTTVSKNNFNAQVLNAFELSWGYPFSVEEAEIYARQAIRFSNWEGIIRAVDAMPMEMKQEDRWQYWLARASEQRSDAASKQAAKSIYQRLASQGDDYHQLLARSRLGQALTLPASQQPSAEDQRRVSQDIHFARAFALKAIQAPATYINREWNWAVRQAYLKQDDGLILAAAKRALDMQWYDRAIYAAERTTQKHNYQYRYVTPFQTYVVNHSRRVGIDPAWVYGLIRQESRFALTARSHVGASGLMQIMPDTAKLVARNMGESYTSRALTDMDTNIRYGTHYLSMIHNQLSANAVLATAGYNAGPNRAKRWQPEQTTLAADQYAESIPFLETRDYVKHVMTNATHYQLILGQTPLSIEQRMGAIPVRQP